MVQELSDQPAKPFADRSSRPDGLMAHAASHERAARVASMEGARYQVCDWHHDFEGEPVRIWSEIGSDGRETRKVEMCGDGSIGIAAVVGDRLFETGSSGLGHGRIPAIAEINTDPQFSAVLTTAAEFDAIWFDAMSEPATRRQISTSSSMADWVEMRARVALHLDGERTKPFSGEKNRSVIFSFPDQDPPANLRAEFSTAGGSALAPGSVASNVDARFLGPLWMVSIVVEGAVFELLMGRTIGTGAVVNVVASPQYRWP